MIVLVLFGQVKDYKRFFLQIYRVLSSILPFYISFLDYHTLFRLGGIVMTKTGQGPWLRVPEAARYTGLSATTLNKLRCYGGGPRYVRQGRCILYRQDWCDEWLVKGAARSTAEYEPPAKAGSAKQKNRPKDGLKAPFISRIALKNAPTFRGFASASREPCQGRAALRLI